LEIASEGFGEIFGVTPNMGQRVNHRFLNFAKAMNKMVEINLEKNWKSLNKEWIPISWEPLLNNTN
jgi:hypothetical protein